MQQEHFERCFSRRKHQSGHWHTTDISAVNPLVRWLVIQLSFKHRELDAFSKRCFPCATVVDFGAGTGSYSRFFLQRRDAAVVAVDWSPEALQAIGPPPRGKILPVCADLHYLPIKSSTIDGLFSIDTLGHLHHQEKALDEINRICRSGAPLFLHSECSDYQQRWPDRRLLEKTGHDPIAALDGHVAVRPANAMHSLYEQRFTVLQFFSPAGIFGWFLGYPEKYKRALRAARMFIPALFAGGAALVKHLPGMKTVFRCSNMFTNRIELFLGIEGGGSCFAQCRRTIPESRKVGSYVPSIDVVIPTYRRSSLLPSLITALAGQCTDNDRIFVVWQGNDPPAVSGSARVFLLHRKKPNLPAARNMGLAAGGNPIVLYLDDDCTVQDGLLDGHRTGYAVAGVGAVGGYINDPLFPPAAELPSWFDVTTGELRQHFALAHSGPAISVMGANMSFCRSTLESIDGFDPHYRRNALFEEIDVSFRLLHAGYTIHYCASARVTHHRNPEGGCRSDGRSRNLFHTFANVAYFACTYAPLNDLRTWIRFWKYRLEYLSRSVGNASMEATIRHDPRLVIAGLAGAVAGIARFAVYGKRTGLPDAVIDAHRRWRLHRRVKAGWIYPHRDRCGIARYSLDYIEALSGAAEVVDIDPRWWTSDRKRFRRALDNCDLLHIQYDTAAFIRRGREFYTTMLQGVAVPVIVTLHEVYDEDPAVFPRSRLTGLFPLLQFRRFVWDVRHPVQRAFQGHLRRCFGALRILIHHRYHADILVDKGVDASLLQVLPHPVKRIAPLRPFAFSGLPCVHLGTSGFINPAYDYDLLFVVLERMGRPWTFSWIGGIRTADQQPFHDALIARIAQRGWQNCFHITGWVPEEQMPSRLSDIDIVLALFKNRSSSGSIARALGACKPVIATAIPLTKEIFSEGTAINTPGADEPPLFLTPANADEVVARIDRLLTDTDSRFRLYRGLSRYVETVSFEKMASRLVGLYRESVCI
ncbi:MAG: methyltransferase domain-containing protein [Chitinispirillaceae bacterium]|nr:methyltransferase domain-containing protein [Chitinispirillaceae bacterium]